MEDVAGRVNAALQDRARRLQAVKWSDFVNRYVLNLTFPAKVLAKNKNNKPLRTDPDLINARLLENRFLFEDLQSLPQMQVAVAQVVENLMRTGCFESVQLEIGTAAGNNNDNDNNTTSKEELNVVLTEKNWYSLYIGGGLKQDGFEDSFSSGAKLPQAQFECSATFPNLTGFLDQTMFKYTVDQASTSTVYMSHEKPLYAWLGDTTPLGQSLLNTAKGSQYSLGVRGILDTLDYEFTRSYKEYLRSITCRLDNSGRVLRPEMATGSYWGFDWSLAWRDVVPRKDVNLPYAADASHEIVALSGSTLTHSLTYDVRSNGDYCDNRFQPTAGLDWHGKLELAGPPGDTGYAKAQGGAAVHLPIIEELVSLHGTVNGGYMKGIDYGGLCRGPTISDRFFVGGPMQLRGFLPAGIGPRSSGKGGSTSPGGDSLGGTLFYTASLAASMAPPGLLREYGVRLFSFVNVGTLVGSPEGLPVSTIVNSTRVAAGAGISANTPMGRLEATYALPIRYGPRDAKRNLQFGFGFNFG
jgi:outer membrane protein assembly factor BamA